MVEIPPFKDAMINLFLTLYLIAEASRRGVVDGRVKLMKLLYKMEEELTKRNLRGPSFVFRKWKYGPWSLEAQNILRFLVDRGLVGEDPTERKIEPTKEGVELIEASASIIERNRELFDLINRVIAHNVGYKGCQLKKILYGTPAPERERVRIEEVERGEVILSPVDEQRAFKFFLVDEDWLDMISFAVSEEFRKAIEAIPEEPDPNKYVPFASLRKSSK